MRIVADDTLALIVDFQERLIPAIENREMLLHNTEILIKGLRALNIPMLVTQQYTKGIGMTHPMLVDALGGNFEYLDKITFSCAEDEAIMKKIEDSGKKNIIICGIEAHICVLQTVIDLKAKGFHVILVEDCVGSRKESDRQLGLKRALLEGVIPTSYESILYELTRVAQTAAFKEILKLIK